MNARPAYLFAALVLAIAGCGSASATSANEGSDETSATGTSSDTGNPSCEPSLESVHQNILIPKCSAEGCHASSESAAGLDLSASADLIAELVSVPAGTCEGWVRIVPGDPSASFFNHKLVNEAPECGTRMPPGPNGLDAAEIACIEGWISTLDSSCETCGGEVCIDLQTDAAHCGECDNACPSGVACVAGACDCGQGGDVCGGSCVNLQSDPDHCGECDNACSGSQVCLEGSCSDDCGDLTVCGQSCVDLQSDPDHCGECDNACADGETCLAGACQCGAAPVSFSAHIQPIFSNSCLGAGCHTGAAPKADLNLSEGQSWAELVNVPAFQCSNRMRVSPGAVDDSYLINKLTGVDMCSGSQMPKNDPALGANQLGLISDWICQGALDN
jgi:hypothetical protein